MPDGKLRFNVAIFYLHTRAHTRTHAQSFRYTCRVSRNLACYLNVPGTLSSQFAVDGLGTSESTEAVWWPTVIKVSAL